MIPYIAVLILIIVAILYQVYMDVESFTDASGNKIIIKDASGNNLMTKDASGNEVKLSGTTSTTASTKEIEERIAKSVAKQVKDDLMSQRAVDEVYDKYAPCDMTDSEAQGQEYQKTYPMPSKQPDMSEYIRKDSIPCWNCSVP
jgi:hypothetical protein